MRPLVSIIIPTYNRADLLKETLDSVLALDYPHWECIVVDDGSTDNTAEMVKAMGGDDNRIRYAERPASRAKGANACRNYGFEISKGIYINWFDSDDLFHPEKFSVQVKMMEDSTANYSVCQCEVFENTPGNNVGLRHEKIHSSDPFGDYLRLKMLFMTPAVLWRKSFLEKFGKLFHEGLQASQEWEFHSRVLNRHPEYLHTSRPLVYIRRHDNNISNARNERKKLFHYILARHLIFSNPELNLDPATREYLNDFMLDYFKRVIRLSKGKVPLWEMKSYMLLSGSLTTASKGIALLSMLTFFLSGRGNVLLEKLKTC